MFDFTGSSLIASIRRRVMLPDTQGAWSDANVLAFANEEVRSYITPMLVELAEEYFVHVVDVSAVSGTAAYAIPAASAGSKVRDVLCSVDGVTYYSLPRVQPEMQPTYPSVVTAQAMYYYVQDTSIVLVPTPTSSFTFKVKFYRRPDTLVTTGYSAVTGYSDSSPNYPVTVMTTTGMAAGYFNIYNSATYETIYEDIYGTVFNSTTVYLSGVTAAQSTYIAANFGAGLMVLINSSKAASLVAQLPVETFDLLSQRTAAAILEALGDPKSAVSMATANDMERRVRLMLSPRTDGRPRKYINRYAPGFLRWPNRRIV